MPLVRSTHRWHKPRVRRRALLVFTALLLTACSGGDDEPAAEQQPEDALRSAIAAVAEWDGITASLRLDVDEEARAGMTSEGDLTDDELDTLLDARLVVTTSGLDEDGDGEAGFETSLVVGGTPLFDLRVVDGERYFVRVDLEEVTALGGETDADIDVEELLMAARMFGLGDVVEAATDGRWVELIGIDDVMELTGVETAEDDEDVVDGDDVEALNERVATTLEDFVSGDVDVTFVGDEDAGERVRIETDGASLEQLVEDIADDVDRAGVVEEATGEDVEDLGIDPDTTVVVDAWIDDGELTQVAFDLAALGEVEGEAHILVALEEFDGSVTAPEDVEPFDVMSLVGAFVGGLGGDAADAGPPTGEVEDPVTPDDEPVTEDTPSEDPTGEGTSTDDDASTDQAPGDNGMPGDGGVPGDAELDGACITDDELADIEEFAGEDAAAELEAMIDSGMIERC